MGLERSDVATGMRVFIRAQNLDEPQCLNERKLNWFNHSADADTQHYSPVRNYFIQQ